MNPRMKLVPSSQEWHFPLRRPHTGIPFGNARQGVLVWGESSLRLTVARAGFWDRRGGGTIPEGTTFAAVRAALESGEHAALDQLFPRRKTGAPFPQQFAGGRLEIVFPSGRPLDGTLDLAGGVAELRIGLHEDDADAKILRITQHPVEEICWIEGDETFLRDAEIRLRPAFDLVKDGEMAALGIAPPEVWNDAEDGGFVQRLPQDAPLAVAWQRSGRYLLLATALGDADGRRVRSMLREFNLGKADGERGKFWPAYWNNAACVSLPDESLQRQYEFGLYRQAGLIRKDTPAATLQGPWMEDTQIPPWSNDYHFNINMELVYGAALATGQAGEMRPLWDMLREWCSRGSALGRCRGTAAALFALGCDDGFLRMDWRTQKTHCTLFSHGTMARSRGRITARVRIFSITKSCKWTLPWELCPRFSNCSFLSGTAGFISPTDFPMAGGMFSSRRSASKEDFASRESFGMGAWPSSPLPAPAEAICVCSPISEPTGPSTALRSRVRRLSCTQPPERTLFFSEANHE